MDPVMQNAARVWLAFFKVKPVLTSLTSLAALAALATGIFYDVERQSTRLQEELAKNSSYQTQVKQLNETETNIKQLLAFIDMQKASLKETEENLLKLKSEQDRLKPLVESDQATVEAIFRAQEERMNAAVWKERGIGFGIGIVASLLASFIYSLITLAIKRRNNASEEI